MSQKPIALDAFQTLADAYATRVDTKPHNAYYERPATLSLLPDVRGKAVLDAGCGPGVYSEWLANHGAAVVALDVSPRMVELAQQRLGAKARVVQADLDKPLDFLEDASFDLVVGALVLDHVRDWDCVFREFYRVLRRHGHLLFSAGHPFADYQLPGAYNYFETELLNYVWKGFGLPVNVPMYRRPLSAYIDPLVEAGFVLERLLEPRPTEQFKLEEPEKYEKLSKQPGFLCVRAAKK